MAKITEDLRGKRVIDFSKVKEPVEIMPFLMELQKKSYEWFLQPDKEPHERKKQGLEAVFRSFFPVVRKRYMLEYRGYILGNDMCTDCPRKKEGKDCLYYACKYPQRKCDFVQFGDKIYRIPRSIEKAIRLKKTYEISLRLNLRLIDLQTREIHETKAFVAQFPLMTEQGTFIINGIEKVVVSQIHRSPGAFYTYDNKERNYGGRISPYRGSWIEFEVDTSRKVINVRMDTRRRKMPITLFLRTLGYDTESIRELFKNNEYIENTLKMDKFTDLEKNTPFSKVRLEAYKEVYSKLRPSDAFDINTAKRQLTKMFTSPDLYDLEEVGRYKLNQKFSLFYILRGHKLAQDIVTLDGKKIAKKGETVTYSLAEKIEEYARKGLIESVKIEYQGKEYEIEPHKKTEVVFLGDWDQLSEDCLDEYLVDDIKDDETGEVLIPANTRINEDILEIILTLGIESFKIKGKEADYSLKDLFQNTLGAALEQNAKVEVVTFANGTEKNIGKPLTAQLLEDLLKSGAERIHVALDNKRTEIPTELIKLLRNLTYGEFMENPIKKGKKDVIDIKVGEAVTIEKLWTLYKKANVKTVKISAEKEIEFKNYLSVERFDTVEMDLRKKLFGRKLIRDVVVDGETIAKSGDEIDERLWNKLMQVKPLWIEVEKGRVLSRDDIIYGIKYLLYVVDHLVEPDDIDHLGNRRIRAVGELIQNEIKKTFRRLGREIYDKLSSSADSFKQNKSLGINWTMIKTALRDFFNTGQLCQFMDQTNVLAELEHKRRISALGPGGLKKERAGFEVRDVHPSHFGRICPIQTPEGQNAGLITSLVVYGRVNKFGFIETPLRKVENGKITDEIVFMEAGMEDRHKIAPADIEIDENGYIVPERVPVKVKVADGYEFIEVERDKVEFIGVSPKQMISVGSSLIPFLEHDDANRALMGTNMQRQAVPLIKPQPAYVTTGMEGPVSKDGYSSITSPVDGKVEYADSTVVRIVGNDGNKYEYKLIKYKKSNNYTCINYRPMVKTGQKIKKGDVLADSYSSDIGELAIGKNVLVAFMPWDGYNYEDAIIVSSKLNEDDVYTSVHIYIHEVEARNTTAGKEEITSDVPGIKLEERAKLDEDGIVREGVEVKEGDILVGKITPKTESDVQPLDRLLRAIFSEKAKNVKDSSYRLPHGEEGIVIKREIYERSDDERENQLRSEVEKVVKVYLAHKKKLMEGDKMAGRHGNKGVISIIARKEDMPVLYDGTSVEVVLSPLGVPSRMNVGQIYETLLGWAVGKLGVRAKTPVFEAPTLDTIKQLLALARLVNDKRLKLQNSNEDHIGYWVFEDLNKVDVIESFVKNGFEATVAKLVKGQKSWIESFDKMPIVFVKTDDVKLIKKAIKDQDLTLIIDISKDEENVKTGFIVDSLIKYENEKYRRYDLDNQEDIRVLKFTQNKEFINELKKVSIFKGESGKEKVRDGRTGEWIDNEVTVGYMYFLKLHHLVDEKIHARSTGPYSTITQQPLGGRAQFGGQRLGEMEVWAIEAYGAAYLLQEMLTIKSDDMEGRVEVYENIVKGNYDVEPKMPESFKVLISELRALGLNVELLTEEELREKYKRNPDGSPYEEKEKVEVQVSKEELSDNNDNKIVAQEG